MVTILIPRLNYSVRRASRPRRRRIYGRRRPEVDLMETRCDSRRRDIVGKGRAFKSFSKQYMTDMNDMTDSVMAPKHMGTCEAP